MTFSWTSYDLLMTLSWLAHDYLLPFSCLSHDFFMHFFYYFLMTFSWLSHGFIITFLPLGTKKYYATSKDKKNWTTSRDNKNHAISRDEKITQLLTLKKSLNLSGRKKIMLQRGCRLEIIMFRTCAKATFLKNFDVDDFLPWPLPKRQAMVMWPPCWRITDWLII